MIGPTSRFVLVAAVAAPFVVGVVVWRLWGRMRLIGRSVGLILVQVIVLGAVVLHLNAANELITTWSGFVGSASGMHVTPIAQVSGQTGGQPSAGNAWIRTSAQVASDRATASASTISNVTIGGEKTGYSLPANIYLPGAYATDPARRFPVIELLAGFPGSIESWTGPLALKDKLDSLIAQGVLPPVIAVMPTQNPDSRHDSECIDATAGYKYQASTYLGADVPAYVAEHYRVGADRVNWVIGGYSTGGYGAAVVGLRYNDQFGSIISLSGYLRPIEDHTTGRLFGHQRDGHGSAVVELLKKPHLPDAIFLIAADDNLRDKMKNVEFANNVPATDMLLSVATSNGGHSFAVWAIGFDRAMRWLASVEPLR